MGLFGFGKKKILIADDDATIRDLLVDIFSDSYTIVEAVDGDDALEKAASAAPGLILLDYNMPGKSGLEVVRALRASGATQNIPIIMVTSQSTLNAVEILLQAGANDYVVKPFEIMNIKTKVEKILPPA